MIGKDRVYQIGAGQTAQPAVEPMAQGPASPVPPDSRIQGKSRKWSRIPRPNVETRRIHHASAIYGRRRVGRGDKSRARRIPAVALGAKVPWYCKVATSAARKIGRGAFRRLRVRKD